MNLYDHRPYLALGLVCALINCGGTPPSSLQGVPHEALIEISRPSPPPSPNKKALVFIHGTIGDPQSTWTGKGDVFWPKLVAQDQELSEFDIFTFGFYSPVLGEGPSIVDVAHQLNDLLASRGILPSSPPGRYEKLYFVGHSLGNLIVRQAMQDQIKFRYIHVPLLVALAAPNQGADLARVAKYISENPALESMDAFQRNDYLKALNATWLKDHPSTEVACAFETLEFPSPEDPGFWERLWNALTPQIGYIVSQSSAISVCSPTRTPRGFATDHVWIAKPGAQRLQDPRHIWLRHQLLAAPFVTRPLTIKLMDSLLVTYDEELRQKGKLNSHQIQDILDEIGLDSDPVQIDTEWDATTDTQRIVRENPDLIVIHFSAFSGKPRQEGDYQGKLAEFVRTVLTQTNTKVLIYSRWREETLGKMEDYFFQRLWHFSDTPSLRGRVFFLDVRRIIQGGATIVLEAPTFGDPLVKDALVKKVNQILELPKRSF